MTKNWIVCIAITISVISLKAQTLNDPIYLNYSYFPSSSFENKNGSPMIHVFESNMTFPGINLGKRVKLYPAVYYRNTSLEYDADFLARDRFPTKLHDIRVSAIFRANISKYFELVALPRILLRSDLGQNIQGGDFFPYMVLLGNYAVKGNPNFKIGVGIALNNDFSYNAIIPTGTLMYNSNKIYLEISYPNVNFLYKTSKNFEVGLFANVDGSISRIHDSANNNSGNRYCRSFQLLFAPAASYRLYQQFYAHFKFGIATLRSLKILDSGFNEIPDHHINLQTSPFLRVGISYRLK